MLATPQTAESTRQVVNADLKPAELTSPAPSPAVAFQQRINRGASALNRQLSISRHQPLITLFGGPGCGRTTLLEATLRAVGGELWIGVIVGNVLADRDAQRLRRHCRHVAAIETVDLTAALVREALEQLDLPALDVIFIERGAAAPPVPMDLGQSATVGIFSVSGGDDKVEHYAERVRNADLVLLTKSDLLPFMPFDVNGFEQRIRRINPAVPILQVSALNGIGIDGWCSWVRQQVRAQRPQADPDPAGAEYFVG